MINSTSVMWTCLPNGVVTTPTGAVASPLTLKLSLYVTPRIAGATGDTLGETVFANWPAQVRAITAAGANGWNITFNGTGNDALSVTLAEDYLGAGYLGVDATALWPAVFPHTTPVQPPNANAPLFKINSYAADVIAKAVRDAHRHVVASQSRTGTIQTTGDDPYSILMNEHKKARYALPRVAKALNNTTRGPTHHALAAAYEKEMGSLGLGYELMRHALFYDRGGYRAKARGSRASVATGHLTPDTVGVSPIDGNANANDFNTILAHLGGQPDLLRKLGLVIDLLVVPPQNVKLLATPTTFTIAAALGSWWGSAANVYNMAPITVCDITTSSFVPTQYDTSKGLVTMTSGMLPLNTSQFSVQTEDTEGAPVKLEIASNGTATQGTGTDASVPFPAFRTAGFTITQNTRELNLANTFDCQELLVAGFFTSPSGNQAGAQLRAQDLVRGYRVDVAVVPNATTTPAASSFQSLCLRDSRVYFPTLGSSLLLSDEGYIKASAATSPLGAGNEELDVHQGIFGWDGWSLAAPRPGRAITATSETDPVVQDEAENQPINSPAGLFPTVEITVRPRAATLPQLRFGNWYSFRARMTDLAGNDMSVPNAVVCSAPTQYLRYEPVANPVLVLEQPLTEGEHVERLVIRSNPYGTTPMNAATYAKTPPAAPMNAYSVPNVRWLAPPKAAWSTAEAHGKFDANFKAMSDIMQKEGKPVAGAGYGNTDFQFAKNKLFALSQKESGTFGDTSVWNTTTGSMVPNPVVVVTPASAQKLPAPTTRGNPLAPGQYTVLKPAAGQQVYLPYFPDPNAAGIHLRTCGEPRAGVMAFCQTVVRTWAPRSGCAWPEMDMPQLQLQEGTTLTITGVDPAATGTPPTSPVLTGNPPIVVTVPAGEQITFQSSSTLVDPTKMANYDAGATAEIPVYAPSRTLTMVHAVQQPKPPGAPAITLGTQLPGQSGAPLTGNIFADGMTTGHLDLMASWTELVDTEVTSGVQTGPNGVRRVQKSGRVQTWTLSATQTTVNVGTTAPLYHEFGDTKTRSVTYEAVATSRFREYFPAALQTNSANFTNSNLANPLKVVPAPAPPDAVRILSTARPAPPSILYVVPTYQWAPPPPVPVPGSTTNTRLGGGLRVYVDRPWFTSGDTEMLGVLVGTGSSSAVLNDYVSQWGLDPIRFPQGEPIAAFNTNLVEGYDVVDGPVPLAEGLGSVTVYGFAPTAFDETRNLWYFDVEIAEETLEAPFVRLALARYQPHSIANTTTDLRLSTVVRADMVKLSQDRTAVYVTQSSNSSINITVSGRVFSNENWSPGSTMSKNNYASGRVVIAQVLETTVANAGEFDWVAVGAQVVLTASQIGGNASTLLSFTGNVPKPAGLKAGAKHQLLLTELEVFPTDLEAKFPGSLAPANYPTGQWQPSQAIGSVGIPNPNPNSTSRVLFSDILALPY